MLQKRNNMVKPLASAFIKLTPLAALVEGLPRLVRQAARKLERP